MGGISKIAEPDVLEYEVKWALVSITTNKASGGDEFPAELFQILKDDAVKVLCSILRALLSSSCCSQLVWNHRCGKELTIIFYDILYRRKLSPNNIKRLCHFYMISVRAKARPKITGESVQGSFCLLYCSLSLALNLVLPLGKEYFRKLNVTSLNILFFQN